MPQIVTVTLNPTIDGSAETEVIRPYLKIRTSNERYVPGGGGLNVARTILALGGEVTALYLAGGPTGAVREELLHVAGVPAQRIPISGTTRIAHTVFERSTGAEYRFVPEGPTIARQEWLAYRDAIAGMAWDYLVASGSLPPGVEVDVYAELAAMARQRGARLVLDTSGAALRAGLEAGVYLVKPSLGELESLAGEKLGDEKSQLEVARGLVRSGKSEIVALSLGRNGALLVTADTIVRARPVAVDAKSAVGAGDSFVAAMVQALSRGLPVVEAFSRGVAAGTAAVRAPGHEAVTIDEVERLLRLVRTQPLPLG